MLVSLLLPAVLCGIAFFFMSFLSWMVLQLHKNDWQKLPNEADIMTYLRGQNVPNGSYMFPLPADNKDAQTPEFQQKYAEGPRGLVTFVKPASMGKNLVFTFLLFQAVSISLAYLASIAMPKGAEFVTVFRFFATATLLTFLVGVVQHFIWFKIRIVGHIIESLSFAIIAGAIFAAMWPSA